MSRCAEATAAAPQEPEQQPQQVRPNGLILDIDIGEFRFNMDGLRKALGLMERDKCCLSCYLEYFTPYLEDPGPLRKICKDCRCDFI
jgi:hypothetical protein